MEGQVGLVTAGVQAQHFGVGEPGDIATRDVDARGVPCRGIADDDVRRAAVKDEAGGAVQCPSVTVPPGCQGRAREVDAARDITQRHRGHERSVDELRQQLLDQRVKGVTTKCRHRQADGREERRGVQCAAHLLGDDAEFHGRGSRPPERLTGRKAEARKIRAERS